MFYDRNLIIESILEEGRIYDDGDITTYNYSDGGLPDLSGSPSGECAWDMPRGRKQTRYYEYYMIIIDDEVDNAKKTTIFVKCPPSMNDTLKVEKMQEFMRSELGLNKSVYKESLVSPRLVRAVNDFMTTYGRIAELTGANVDDLIISETLPIEEVDDVPVEEPQPIKKNTSLASDKYVENQMAEIKQQAYDLAKEKYDTLVRNGVDKELAQKEAKKTYMNLIVKFQKERGSMLNDAPRRRVDNPLLAKNVRGLIDNSVEKAAKEAAVAKYKELIRRGKSQEYAKRKANELYRQMK